MNRACVIGCSVVLALCAAVAAAIFVFGPQLAKKGFGMFNDAMAEVNRVAAFEAAWTPPPASGANWFPPEIGDWKISAAQQTTTGVPRLKIDRGGISGAYARPGETVEVDVIAANSLEKEALFTRAKDALGSGSGTRVSSQNANRFSERIGGTDHTLMWWLKDWMFIFHARGQTDPAAFAEAYLQAIEPRKVLPEAP